MWYIVEQSSSDIRLVFLSKTKDKCITEYERLETEDEKEAKQQGEERNAYYYYGHFKGGIKK